MFKPAKFIAFSFALFTCTIPLISSAVSPVPPNCITLNKEFGVGTKDTAVLGEVSKLQDFLIAKKYLSTKNISTKVTNGTDKKGLYGRYTQEAVGKYQLANKVVTSRKTVGFGRVGKGTRAALKCKISSVPTKTVKTTTESKVINLTRATPVDSNTISKSTTTDVQTSQPKFIKVNSLNN